jgi:Flp pilus assembly protein TadD
MRFALRLIATALIANIWIATGLWAQAGNLLEQADAAFRAGDIEQAAALSRQALAQDPSSVHAHMILGIIAAQANQWNDADTRFQSVIQLAPQNPFGYFYLGQSALYQQQWGQAVGHFSKALEYGYPDQQRLMIELALAQNEAGQPQQALENLSKVQPPPQGPLAAQYHATQAFALGKLSQSTAAIEAMRRARDLDDSSPHYWEFLINALISADDTYKALVEAIQAQRKFPDDPQIQYQFAIASYYVTESPLTSLALRNLREADPHSPQVLLVEGLLYRKQGKAEEAMRTFTQAAEEGVPDAHLLLGLLHKENGDYETAEREFREAEKANPGNGQVLLELGKVLLVRGNLKEAQVRLEQALVAMPAAAGVHYQLGLLYGRLGEKEKAQQHLRLSRQP